MNNSLKKYEFWFVVGSQDLYGPDVLKTVDEHSKIMVEGFNKDPLIPGTVVFKPVVRNSNEIYATLTAANADPACADEKKLFHFLPKNLRHAIFICVFRHFLTNKMNKF